MEPADVAEVEMPKEKSKKKNPPAEAAFGVRLPNELRADVETICADDGIPLGRFIREAVEERALSKRPDLARRALFRSLTIASANFERALQIGVLAETEAEEQADEIRRFFGQLIAVLQIEPEHESDEAGEAEGE